MSKHLYRSYAKRGSAGIHFRNNSPYHPRSSENWKEFKRVHSMTTGNKYFRRMKKIRNSK